MTQKKVACLLANGFEDSEFRRPIEALRAKGFTVDVVGATRGETLTGMGGRERAEVTCAIADASVVDYLGMLIPGGTSPAALCKDARFVDFVKAFDSSHKPIAAICHGPQLLLAAGLVKGRKLTGFAKIQEALRDAGGNVVDAPLVAEGNWLTSRKPDDLPQFCEAVALQFDANADQSWMARGDVHAH